jgi:hypothetical protein
MVAVVLRPTRRRSGPSFPLSFRMTQALTGHRVFDECVQKIRRELTDTCHHCEEGEDTVQHTLEFCKTCPATSDCRECRPVVSPGSDAEGQQEFLGVRFCCEEVILAKEFLALVVFRAKGRPCGALNGHRGRHTEEVLGSPRICTTAQEKALGDPSQCLN